MKKNHLKLISVFFLSLSLIGFLMSGCENNDTIITVEPVTPDENIVLDLDNMFSKENDCLIDFKQELVYEILYTQADLNKMDTCSSVPTVDFENYTLIVGEVMVPGIVSTITNVVLNYNQSKDKYILEVSVNECEECFPSIDYLFFWRLYPKLSTDSDFEIIINKY